MVVGLLVAIPLAALIYGSFRTSAPGIAGEWTLRNYAGLATTGVLSSMGTTLWIGLASSALCIVVGTAIPLALFAKTAALGGFYVVIYLLVAWLIFYGKEL